MRVHERKSLRDGIVRRAALVVSESRLVGDRVRNRATLTALRRSSTVAEVGEVFVAGLRDATRRGVKLTIEAGVDVHATKRIAMMTVQLLRQHRGLTDLADVRINAPHERFRSSSFGAVDPNFRGAGGSTLWFNSERLQPGGVAQTDADIKELYRAGNRTAAWRYGLEGVVAHEVGHLIGNAATLAARGTHLEKSLAQRTVNSLESWQRAQVEAKIDKEYTAAADLLVNATPQKIIRFHNFRLKESGAKPDPRANPEQIRSKILTELPDRYYGMGPRNELSAAAAQVVTSPYASVNVWEQHGEAFGAVVLLGVKADAVSHATYEWMMDALNHKCVDRSREFLNRRDVLVGDAEKAGPLAPSVPPPSTPPPWSTRPRARIPRVALCNPRACPAPHPSPACSISASPKRAWRPPSESGRTPARPPIPRPASPRRRFGTLHTRHPPQARLRAAPRGIVTRCRARE